MNPLFRRLLLLTLATPLAVPAAVITFRNGLDGYGGTVDTFLDEAQPDTAFPNDSGNNNSVDADGNNATAGRPHEQALLRFDNIFGGGLNQIPAGSVINSATLAIEITNTSNDTQGLFHRMVVSWGDASTWNSLGGGVTLGTDALAALDATLPTPITLGSKSVDVTTSVQSWSAGGDNFGWAVLPSDTGSNGNGFNFRRSESSVLAGRPTLVVDYTVVPEPATVGTFTAVALGGLGLWARRRRAC
ncbi:MAG: DNRLRE domain-containing protein [Limisphaerales bacterium]